MDHSTQPSRILISGATGKLGYDIALHLASVGWPISFIYKSNSSRADRLEKELKKRSQFDVQRFCYDLCDPSKLNHLIDEIEAIGPIYGLIHAVGSFQRKDLSELNDDEWFRAFDENLNTTFYLCRRVALSMQKHQKGRIITFGLAGSQRIQTHISAHAISKRGVAELTKSFAKCFGSDHITANCIALGVFEGSESSIPITASNIPANRFGSTKDLIPLIEYLLSEHANYLNGSEISLSGGFF